MIVAAGILGGVIGGTAGGLLAANANPGSVFWDAVAGFFIGLAMGGFFATLTPPPFGGIGPTPIPFGV